MLAPFPIASLAHRLPHPAPYSYKYALALLLCTFEVSVYEAVGRATEGRHFDFMTGLDARIPYLPWTVWLYLPMYAVFFHVALYAIRSWDTFFRAAASLVLASLIAWTVFLIIPSSYPRPAVTADGSLTTELLLLVRVIDPTTNTFPSMHVGLTVTTALACLRENTRRGLWLLAAAAVPSLSILTVKQHYVVDLAGGLAIAVMAHVAVFGWSDVARQATARYRSRHPTRAGARQRR